MGRFLQIRVMAFTYDETEMAKAWPTLCALAFPTASPSSVLPRTRGVLELVDTLVDQVRFNMLNASVQKILAPRVDQARQLKQALEQALADWNPQKANALSDSLEELLDELEGETPSL